MESAIKTTKNNAEKTRNIYRAGGLGEYKDLMSTRKFKGIEERTMAAKEFGNDFNETLEFANESINRDNAAIMKVTIPENMYNRLYHMNLDMHFFKSGTPVVEPEILDSFNKSIIKIEHSY